MKKLFILLLALIALAALGWFAIYTLKAPAIQADIQNRSQEALASNNLDWVQVDADGRDITLSGMAPTDQLRQYALDTANVYGVNQLTDNIMVQQSTLVKVDTVGAGTPKSNKRHVNSAAEAKTDVDIKTAQGKTKAVPYRMTIVRDDAGVYQFEGVVPNSEFKQGVDSHLVSLGADPTKARWNVVMGSEPAPANWQSSTLKSLSALQLLNEGSMSIGGDKAVIQGTAPSRDVSDQAEALAQALASDFTTMDVALGIASSKPLAQKSEPTPMVGSAKYAEKFCQTEFNTLLRREKIQFESGATQLQAKSLQLLRKVMQVANRCPDHQIQVHGYTDSRGAAANNKRLSQARAEAVLSMLVSLGVSQTRLIAVGHGEARPIASNKTERGRAKNRRIELIVKGIKK